MLGILLGVWSVLIWPLAVRIKVSLGSGHPLSGSIAVKSIGLGLKMDWKLTHTVQGATISLRFSDGRYSHSKSIQSMRHTNEQIIEAIRTTPSLQKALASYISSVHLKSDIRIGTGNAAETALVCGSLSAILGCLPHARGQVIPDFQNEILCLDLQCITSFQLGKLFLTVLVYLRCRIVKRIQQIAGGVFHG